MLLPTNPPPRYNAADTVLKSKLEALPTIGTVAVSRAAPDTQMGYAYTVEFTSNVGAFPSRSGNLAEMVADGTLLTGTGADVSVATTLDGSDPLGGSYKLSVTQGLDTEETTYIDHDASAAEVQAALEALSIVGGMDVTRTASSASGLGYLVTFGTRCAPLGGTDVCNTGDVPTMSMIAGVNGLTGCKAGGRVSAVTEVLAGGPAVSSTALVTDLSGGYPLAEIVTGLAAGVAQYVRVAAHTARSYGYFGLTTPEHATPTFNQPGAPPPVRLVSSTRTTITVEWDAPTENGGSSVTGYEVWYSDWKAEETRVLLYDGTADPSTFEFTADPTNTPRLSSGRKYAFQVRAVNLCDTTDPDKACYSPFSSKAIFTVAAPRAPQPPLPPTRNTETNLGTSSPDDATVVLDWLAPLDTGGAAVTGYRVWMRDTTGSITELGTGPGTGTVDVAALTASTEASLSEGELYEFWVMAGNDQGWSGGSPRLAVVAADVPGRDLDKEATYSQVAPTVTDVMATEISIEWVAPVDTGASPITGYEVWMFPGVAHDTQADPYPVKREIQKIATSVTSPLAAEVQTIVITDAVRGGSVRLTLTADAEGGQIAGVPTDAIAFQDSTTAAEIEDAIEAVSAALGDVTVTMASDVTSDTWSVTFTNFVGTLAKIGVNTDTLTAAPGKVIETTVTRDVAGTETCRGDFTVKVDGVEETLRLPFDASADAVRVALENLDTVGLVDVAVDTGLDDGMRSWTVEFVNNVGDLAALYPTPGRLTGGAAAVAATSIQQGSAALLLDTVGPHVRDFAASGLSPETNYAFRVVPINAVGRGVPTAATPTIVARAGASPQQTTSKGPATRRGMSGIVLERQVITVSGASPGGSIALTRPGGYAATGAIDVDPTADDDASAADMRAKLEAAGTGLESVAVTRTTEVTGATTTLAWTVTFRLPTGDLDALAIDDALLTGATADAFATEFLRGQANEFLISPTKASGRPLKDVTSHSGFGAPMPYSFAGKDVFFTELWHPPTTPGGKHTWASDGGVAQYLPIVFDVQRLAIPLAATGTFMLTMDTSDAYDEASGGWPRVGGVEATTGALDADVKTADLKAALELLPNIEGVDVAYRDSESLAPASLLTPVDALESASGGGYWYITFTHDLGARPLLQVAATPTGLTGGSAVVTHAQIGRTEVQDVVLDADVGFVSDVQELTIADDATYTVTIPGASGTADVGADAGAAALQAALESLDTVNTVAVTKHTPSTGLASYLVTFLDPVGDVGAIEVDDVVPSGSTVSRAEVTKGVSPLMGTFVLSYDGAYTQDIDFDASAATVKARIEALATVDGDNGVDVTRLILGASIEYKVTFTKQAGDLPMMQADPVRYEKQRVRSMGGDPTPLGGSFTLGFGGDETGQLPYDATDDEVKAALEGLPSLGGVDVHRDAYANGQFAWRVTFRGNLGDVPLLTTSAEGMLLTGSDAAVVVSEMVAGDEASLTGSTPGLTVVERQAGRPGYLGAYAPAETGAYLLAVRQLAPGGLSASYFDNQWLVGDPSLERVDPTINFDWGTNAITAFGRDYVSVRWEGKLVAPTTEEYTLYAMADDGVRVYVDHVLVLEEWDECCNELRAKVHLVEGVHHDIRVEYKEETGTAHVQLQWSSLSVRRATVPSEALYHATHIATSPHAVTVVPGAADYPFSTATGQGLSKATAGLPASFVITAKDASGNVKIYDDVAEAGGLFDVELSYGDGTTIEVAPNTLGQPVYLGDGRYSVEYTALKAGAYSLSVRTGGIDIQCGAGEAAQCSPFAVDVEPGPTVASSCEAEAIPTMDSLVEAAAGDTGNFTIVAKDTYGNNRRTGGDLFVVLATLSTDADVQYLGYLHDKSDGTYVVTYTVEEAGAYDLAITLNKEPIRQCTPPDVGRPHLTRAYNGQTVYAAPAQCGAAPTTLTVVHGDYHGASSTHLAGAGRRARDGHRGRAHGLHDPRPRRVRQRPHRHRHGQHSRVRRRRERRVLGDRQRPVRVHRALLHGRAAHHRRLVGRRHALLHRPRRAREHAHRTRRQCGGRPGGHLRDAPGRPARGAGLARRRHAAVLAGHVPLAPDGVVKRPPRRGRGRPDGNGGRVVQRSVRGRLHRLGARPVRLRRRRGRRRAPRRLPVHGARRGRRRRG